MIKLQIREAVALFGVLGTRLAGLPIYDDGSHPPNVGYFNRPLK